MLNSQCPRISWTSFRFRPRITNQDAQVWRRWWKRKPNKVERRQRPLPVHRPTDQARDRRHLGQRRQRLAVHRLEDRGHGIQLGASRGPVRRGIALDGDGAVQLRTHRRIYDYILCHFAKSMPMRLKNLSVLISPSLLPISDHLPILTGLYMGECSRHDSLGETVICRQPSEV